MKEEYETAIIPRAVTEKCDISQWSKKAKISAFLHPDKTRQKVNILADFKDHNTAYLKPQDLLK